MHNLYSALHRTYVLQGKASCITCCSWRTEAHSCIPAIGVEHRALTKACLTEVAQLPSAAAAIELDLPQLVRHNAWLGHAPHPEVVRLPHKADPQQGGLSHSSCSRAGSCCSYATYRHTSVPSQSKPTPPAFSSPFCVMWVSDAHEKTGSGTAPMHAHVQLTKGML